MVKEEGKEEEERTTILSHLDFVLHFSERPPPKVVQQWLSDTVAEKYKPSLKQYTTTPPRVYRGKLELCELMLLNITGCDQLITSKEWTQALQQHHPQLIILS